ncbi:hypothetical protein MnTg03_00626 [bacterium MnTg03]|nr:hypothetical protein MnTg03_00626 [bacterium MnTg03]
MKNVKYSLYLNKVRKNLAANLDRSPLIKEPLDKSYGDHWLSARFGIKARFRRHAVACQEVATPSPDCAESPAGRALKHASATLQPSPRTKAISFGLRLASTCFRARRDPIGLVQRFPCYCYASAGDRSTLFTIFTLSFVPFMEYAG